MADLPPPPEPAPPSLLGWAVGSFHAALLVALGVTALHLSGAAGDILGGIGTVPGAVAYLYLWGVATWTTGRALRAGEVSPVDGVPDRWTALRAALSWGAVTGLLVFAPGYLVVAGLLLFSGGVGAVSAVLVVALLGGAVAALVGAVVGGLFAALDVALLGAAALVAGEAGTGPPDEVPADDA